MPITATLAMVAAAAMAGVPLLNGFLSKEMFFSESLRVEGPVRAINSALPFIATLWGMFSVAYSLRFIHGVFFGPPPDGLPRVPQEPPRWMRLPIEFLVLACLVVGILPALTIGPILDIAVRSVLGPQVPQYSLSVWHGLTVPLMMSMLALGGGAVLYLLLQPHLARGKDAHAAAAAVQGRQLFDSAPGGGVLAMGAGRSSEPWARGDCKPQLGLLLLVALAAGLWPVWERGLQFGALPPTPVGSALSADVDRRRGMRGGGRLAGQVPPTGRARARWRRRAGGLPHIRVALGARTWR